MARSPFALPDHLGRALEDWIEIVLVSVFLVGYFVGIVVSGRSLKLRLLVLSVLVVLLLASLYWPVGFLEIALGSSFFIGFFLGAFLWRRGLLNLQLALICAVFILITIWLYFT